MTCVWIVCDYKRSYCIESLLLSNKMRTGSASWPQFAKVASQVTRLDVRRTAYCERPSCLIGSECQNTFESYCPCRQFLLFFLAT